MHGVAFRILPDEDLRSFLVHYCVAHEIEAACVLSCAGSLRRATLRFAGRAKGERLDKQFEIVSLTGTVSRHGCHLHLSIADDRGEVMGGHLMEGCRVYTTAEVVLGVIEDTAFLREHDPMTGFRELKILMADRR
jgi:predicted DNA-binding protein with PD1-like motif